MTQFKGTPGPWFVDASSVYIEINNADGTICDTCSSGVYFDDGNCFGPTTIANANLIAAAPDLLEALIEARVWVQGWNAAHETEDSEKALIACNQAIAKALGEQS